MAALAEDYIGDGEQSGRMCVCASRYRSVASGAQARLATRVHARACTVSLGACLLALAPSPSRRQQELTRNGGFNDAAKRALLASMVPEDLAEHFKLNARRLDSYQNVGWEVTDYTLLSPDAGRLILQSYSGFRSLAHDLAKAIDRLPDTATPALIYAISC